jgi:dTDP-4-amino-4,6-dideoxygalactose transaminase
MTTVHPPIPLLDLKVLYERQREALDAAIHRVLESQGFILGPEVAHFEREIAEWLGAGAECAIGVANGSDAIVLVLRALGIGPGDHVVCPAYSFTSTATSISLVGATPRFADIEADSLNLDVEKAIEAVTPETKALIVVHLYGRAANVPELRRRLTAAGRGDITIIEDAAQALGSAVGDTVVGQLGDIMTTSFFPSKNLGCFGDGGLVFTTDTTVAERVRTLRAHGARQKYKAELVGQNSRLDAIQAAVLRVKLPALRGWCDERRANAAAYRVRFALYDWGDAVTLPPGDEGGVHHIYNQLNLQVRDRDGLVAHLNAHGIGSAIYYPHTLPDQPCYADLPSASQSFPVSTRAAQRSLAIPVYPGLSVSDVDRVVTTIAQFYGV